MPEPIGPAPTTPSVFNTMHRPNIFVGYALEREPCLSQQRFGDDRLLNLTSAFVNTQQADVAIEALNLVFRHVSRATVDLHGAVGDAAHRFGAKVFGGSDVCRDALASIETLGDVLDHK